MHTEANIACLELYHPSVLAVIVGLALRAKYVWASDVSEQAHEVQVGPRDDGWQVSSFGDSLDM